MIEGASAPRADPPHFDAVLLTHAAAEHSVGGLTLLERAAFTLARAGAGRLLCVGDRPQARLRLPPLPLTWVDGGDRSGIASWCATAAPVMIVMDAAAVVDRDTVAALAADSGPGTLALADGAPLWRVSPASAPPLVAAWLDSHTHATSGGLRPDLPEVRTWRPPPGALAMRADDPHTRVAAEHALYARLARPGDGWFTRLVDRRISRTLTRLLVPTGITPNQITLASMTIGIAGGVLFASGSAHGEIVGALLFLLSTIVDGCDGELARLTHQESELGARLDLIGDNIVHLFLFGGIAWGLHRRLEDPRAALLGGVLVAGVLLAMATVYHCLVRRVPTPAQRAFFDAFGSREFAYVLVVLTLAGRLEWFLWIAAFGTYVFVAGLLILGYVRRD